MNQDNLEEISFNKIIPVRRTSEPSVLSSLSLKSNLLSKSISNNNNNNNKNVEDENIGVKLPFNSITKNNITNNITTTTTTTTTHNNKTVSNFNIQGMDTVDDDYDSEENNNTNNNSDNDNNNNNTNSQDALTKQALRKLSFLKITNSNEGNVQENSDGSRVQDNIKVDKNCLPSNSNLTPKKHIKQVSSFLYTNTPILTKKSSLSSISSIHPFRNPKSTNNLRNIHNNNENNNSNNNYTARSLLKSNSSSVLFNKSFSTQPLSINTTTTPPTSISNNNNSTRNLSKQYIKQINNPKRPLYIPAVLRNVSETNLTNDDILNLNSSISQSSSPLISSTNSLYNNSLSFDSSILNHNNNNNINFSRSPLSFGPSPISSNISTHSSFSNSNRYIKTSHWVPDSMRSNCAKCNVQFNLWERKHHCRHCGEIFCHKDLSNKLYLNCNAQFINPTNFNGKKFLSKICDSCYNNYKQSLNTNHTTIATNNQTSEPKQLIIQTNQSYSIKTSGSSNTNETNTIINMNSVTSNNNKNTVKYKNDTIVGSVSNWNWSSF